MADENPFRAALEWFGPNGERWRKLNGGHPWRRDEGCALVAVSAVSSSPEWDCASRLGRVIWEQYPDRVWDNDDDMAVAHFNDHPDTTFDDVRTVFEKAAVRWDERV